MSHTNMDYVIYSELMENYSTAFSIPRVDRDRHYNSILREEYTYHGKMVSQVSHLGKRKLGKRKHSENKVFEYS